MGRRLLTLGTGSVKCDCPGLKPARGPVRLSGWWNRGFDGRMSWTPGPAPTYLHPVPRHLGSGNRRNVGCVDNPHSLMLESASTSGAGVLTHRHLYKRLGDFIGRRQLSVAERPHTRLAAGTLGSAASPTLGERSRLALSCSLELGDLLVQLFLGRRQLRNLPLQLRHQPQQLVALRGREVFGLTHSQSIKTCSVPHNPPTDADPANQLPFGEDDSRVRQGNAAQNLSVLRRMALNMLKRETTSQGGLAAKRKRAGWDEDYLLLVLAQ